MPELDVGPILSGTYRVRDWQRRFPVIISTVYEGTVWYRNVCGVAVGSFGRCVYIAYRGRGT